MTIDLASVGVVPKKLSASFGTAEADIAPDGVLKGDAEFSGEIFSRDAKVHIVGTVTADVELECTRCLEPIERPVSVEFESIFVDASRERLDADAEIDSGELDESLVIGGQVELADVVREQIVLSLPEQVLCSDDCKGICDRCGANRNLLDCNCREDDFDPRWAALRDLK